MPDSGELRPQSYRPPQGYSVSAIEYRCGCAVVVVDVGAKHPGDPSLPCPSCGSPIEARMVAHIRAVPIQATVGEILGGR